MFKAISLWHDPCQWPTYPLLTLERSQTKGIWFLNLSQAFSAADFSSLAMPEVVGPGVHLLFGHRVDLAKGQ